MLSCWAIDTHTGAHTPVFVIFITTVTTMVVVVMVVVVVVLAPFFGFKCRSFPPLLRPTATTTNTNTTINRVSPVVVSRRYLSICGKVISGRSSAAPYRSRNEQTSAKLGQSGGPELLNTAGAAIFPGGEKQEGRARLAAGMRLCANEMNGGSEASTGVRLHGGRARSFRSRLSQ